MASGKEKIFPALRPLPVVHYHGQRPGPEASEDRNEEIKKFYRKTCLSDIDDVDELMSATGGWEPVFSSVALSGTPNDVGQDYDMQSEKWICFSSTLSRDEKFPLRGQVTSIGTVNTSLLRMLTAKGARENFAYSGLRLARECF